MVYGGRLKILRVTVLEPGLECAHVYLADIQIPNPRHQIFQITDIALQATLVTILAHILCGSLVKGSAWPLAIKLSLAKLFNQIR